MTPPLPTPDLESRVFDLLEAVKPLVPAVAGGFSRSTGGVEWDYVLRTLRQATPPPTFRASIQALSRGLGQQGQPGLTGAEIDELGEEFHARVLLASSRSISSRLGLSQ